MLAALAVLLMTLNHRSLLMRRSVADLSLITLPIQEIVDAPIKGVHRLAVSLLSEHQVIAQNAKLRAHELLLQAKLQRLLSLEHENAQLHKLLSSTATLNAKVVEAQLLAVDLDPNLQQVVLNKGAEQKVYQGQPVLDAYGVIGQVVSVGPLTSKVLLITDSRSAIPVQDNRNGERAIAVGMGAHGELVLINVPDTSDIKQGDLLVTSGLGLRYPVGYPVGVVSHVKRSSGQRFAAISLDPSAHLDRTQQVLLAWPTQAKLQQAVNAQLRQQLPSSKAASSVQQSN